MANNRDFITTFIAQSKAAQAEREAEFKAQKAAEKAELERRRAEYRAKCLIEFKAFVKSPEFTIKSIEQGTQVLTKARELFFGCASLVGDEDLPEEKKILSDAEDRYAKMVEAAETARARELSAANRQKELEASAAKALRSQNEAIAKDILYGPDVLRRDCFKVVTTLLPHLNNFHAEDSVIRKAARKAKYSVDQQIFFVNSTMQNRIENDVTLFLYTFGDITHKLMKSGITLEKIKTELAKKYYTMNGYFVIPDGGVMDLYENKDGICFKIFTISQYLKREDIYGKVLLTRKQLDDNVKLTTEDEAETEENNPFNSNLSFTEPNLEDDFNFDMDKIFNCLEDDSNSDSDQG